MTRLARAWASLAVAGIVAGAPASMPAHALDSSPDPGFAHLSLASTAERQVTGGPTGSVADVQTLSSAPSQEALSSASALEECLTVGGDEVLTVGRFAGLNRYETAICVSFWSWPDHDDPDPDLLKAGAVVLARGDLFPDALAGGPLAAYAEGPLLITRPSALDPAVAQEIQRVLAPGGHVYLLGGTSALSAGIAEELQNMGYNTKRLAGTDRYRTALAIADELPDTSNFFFATGTNFPDALAAGTAAAAYTLGAKFANDPEIRPVAVLLTNGSGMPAVVANFVNSRGDQFEEWALLTAGGPADAAAAAEFGAQNLVARFVGTDRYHTATLIADGVFTDQTGVLVGDGVGLATGGNFPDALAASAYLAWFENPLLLTAPTTLSARTANFLTAHAGEGNFLEAFGGEAALSQSALDAAESAFRP